MALKPVTVTQLNEYISRVLGTDPLLAAVVVKGEVSNLKYHSSGHVYFSIMDATSKISCFLNKSIAQTRTYQLEEGMDVTITGQVSVFAKNGTYSLYVKHIENEGAGALAVAFEEMKMKLLKEGLFDRKHKKPIPKFPKKIGIITSSTGAAVEDILKILKTRNNMVDIVIFPVLVQGQFAAADISSMIDYVNENYDDIDTLIVGRGGGSADDLWAFNEEPVARSIFRSRIPIISAVGHEIDFTISDLVADLRAETPTAAAQIAVPDVRDLADSLDGLYESLYVYLTNKVMYNKLRVDNLLSEITSEVHRRIDKYSNQLENAFLVLEENNPTKILESGFSVLTDNDGKIIDSVDNILVDSHYRITVKDGFADCIITETGSDSNG